jgi:hypothetical protein
VLKKNSGKNPADTTESSDEEEEAVERMTSEDAYWFPVM